MIFDTGVVLREWRQLARTDTKDAAVYAQCAARLDREDRGRHPMIEYDLIGGIQIMSSPTHPEDTVGPVAGWVAIYRNIATGTFRVERFDTRGGQGGGTPDGSCGDTDSDPIQDVFPSDIVDGLNWAGVLRELGSPNVRPPDRDHPDARFASSPTDVFAANAHAGQR